MKRLLLPIVAGVVFLMVAAGFFAWIKLNRHGTKSSASLVVSRTSILPPRSPASTELKELADPVTFVEDRVVGGVGILIAKSTTGYQEIIGVAKSSPADLAGVRSGDFVVSVAGKSTRGMSLDEVRKTLAGPAGSTVTFEVRKPSSTVVALTLNRMARRGIASLSIDMAR